MNARFHFSIRDILSFTVLAGIGVSWYLDHRAATIRAEADWDALSRIDTGLQAHAHFLKEFQKELNELQQEGQTDDES
jgi:hypothetical protein